MKKRTIITVAASVLVSALVIVTAVMIPKNDVDHSVKETLPDTTDITTTLPAGTEPPPKEPFVSKKNFDEFRETYPHMYAWIEVPGTYIDYPVIQHPDNEEYYLRRDERGNYSINGCIYSEHLYNKTDFTDPVTILYGHYVYEWDGFKYFGGLQSTYKDDLETCGEIIIHQPDKELHYEVFAAFPNHPFHILHGRDYTKAKQFNDLVEEFKNNESPDATINKDCDVKAGDRLLILSTCYNGNTDKRFLVVAKLVEEIN